MLTFDIIFFDLITIMNTEMAETNYFELRLTATTNSLYEYLTNTFLHHGSYLNPIKLGSFIHGATDNTYTINGQEKPAVDESLPEIDGSYDGIKWLVSKSKWLEYNPKITAPKLQYIEIVNMNPFKKHGKFTYHHPLTERDWKGYFLPDDRRKADRANSYTVAPNGHLFLAPSKASRGRNISVLISKKRRNDGIIAMFNIGFTLKVEGEIYNCIVDPVIKVKSPRD